MNPIFTVIARVSDGLMLAEAMDSADSSSKMNDLDSYRTQAKKIIKSLSHKSPSRLTIDSEPNYFCYVMENDVCYLSLCEKSYPKKLAIKFLEELQKEFDIQYGADIPSTKRPYAFIKFGMFQSFPSR